jgi:hypothetical protein
MQAACLSPRVFTETDDHDHIVPDRLSERESARAHACVRACACMHVRTQTSTPARTHARARTNARMHAPTHIHTPQCTHTHTIVFGFQALDAITSYSCIKQFNKSMKQFNDSIKCVARGTRRKLFLNPTLKLNPKP